jgi:hypothetical protein
LGRPRCGKRGRLTATVTQRSKVAYFSWRAHGADRYAGWAMEPMDYFERYPWLLIPIIIITMEVWHVLKAWALRLLNRKELDAPVAR